MRKTMKILIAVVIVVVVLVIVGKTSFFHVTGGRSSRLLSESHTVTAFVCTDWTARWNCRPHPVKRIWYRPWLVTSCKEERLSAGINRVRLEKRKEI